MVAAYLMVVFAVDLGWPYWLSFLLALAGMALLGVIFNLGVDYPLRHRSFLPVIIATIGASILMANSALAIMARSRRCWRHGSRRWAFWDPGMLTLALATVRTRWAAFAGTFAALALGVSVIATMTLVLAAASGGNPHQHPERFAAVPYVIQVDPDLQVRDLYGLVDSVPLCAARCAGLGCHRTARRAPDSQLRRPGPGRAHRPARRSAGPWARLVLRRVRPVRSHLRHAPSVDDETGFVAGPATLGSRVSVVTAAGSRTYTIDWHSPSEDREQPIFFTDAGEAARLSPGVDALVTYDAATAAAPRGSPVLISRSYGHGPA